MIDELAREIVRQAIAATGAEPHAADDDTAAVKSVLPRGTSGDRLEFEIARRLTGVTITAADLAGTIGRLVQALTLRIPPKLYYCPATDPPHPLTNPLEGPRCPDHGIAVTAASASEVLAIIRR